MKKLKKLLTIGLAIMLTFCVSVSFVGCKNSPDDFTVEEHIGRISERVKASNREWGYPNGEVYQDFAVYPLYNKNEELTCFLVEFNPYGFVFIRIRDLSVIDKIIMLALGQDTDMYVVAGLYNKNSRVWSPYTIDETKGYDYENRQWILDENGERIYHYKSPYFVTNNINERKYLLESGTSAEYICAVKNESNFTNLISGQKIEFLQEDLYLSQATLYITSHKGSDSRF